MRNTYKIPAGCTSISIEQIGNKIVTEFIPACKFKAGDVLFEDGRIMIYKSYKNIESFNIHALIYYYIGKEVSYDGYYGVPVESCRLATAKEKQLLFDALAKVGKQWNAETLQIEDLKVVPKVGDCVKLKYGTSDTYLIKISKIRGIQISSGRYLCSDGEIDSDGCFNSYDSIEILTPTQFQSEVNALGFEYDFKSDTFKELKWELKLNSQYYFFDSLLDSPLITTNTECMRDKDRIALGNCFKTKSECESAIEKIKNVLKSK